MLINLSNHPFQSWSATQTAAAIERYQQVIDLPFPQVDPHSSLKEIMQIAKFYLENIINMFSSAKNEKNAVHLMGEFTLTYCLIRLLEEENIETVSSTTERFSVDTTEGKIVKFTFVSFRPYFDVQTKKNI